MTDANRINVICEQLEEAAEHEVHNPTPSGVDPDLLLDAKTLIDELWKQQCDVAAMVADLLTQLTSAKTELVNANAEIQNLIAAGGVH